MTLDISVHKNILLKILKDIYSDTSISPYLGFKGGTAAFLFYGLERFSVDLDFDLLDDSKEDTVFLRVEQIVKKYGHIKEVRKKRFNLFFLLSYENAAQNIKVEINRRSFGSHYEIKSYLGISMLVMVRENMFAHKLMAMHERMGKTNRDIFDVWFFSKNGWPINKKIVEERSRMSFADFLKVCVVELEKLSSRSVLGGMGELLNEKQKNWARKKLIPDTIFFLRLMRENEK